VVAHDLASGIALRPAWGPMNGGQAVGEQALVEHIAGRMPAGSLVAPDRNLGVFSAAWYAGRKNHPLPARTTDARARAPPQGELPRQTDPWVDWKPSRWDRIHHPDLPGDARNRVRLIATRVARRGKLTRSELDSRSLKQTVHLHSPCARTPDLTGAGRDGLQLRTGGDLCGRAGGADGSAAHAAPHRPVQARVNQPSAELSRGDPAAP
jgi:hypothetical protein